MTSNFPDDPEPHISKVTMFPKIDPEKRKQSIKEVAKIVRENQKLMNSREAIKQERISKGFCTCHECIERDYEHRHDYDDVKNRVLIRVSKKGF